MGGIDNGTRHSAEEFFAGWPRALQQRAHELRSLLSLPPPTLAAVVPADASCESLQVDPTLGFLDGFVAEALAGGAEPFVPPESRAPAVGTATPTSSTGVACSSNGGGGGHELRFDAYAHPAEMAAAAATGYSAGGFSDPGAAVAGRPAPTAPTSQLRLNTGDGPKKWAPQPPPPQSRSPAPAAPAAAAAAAIAAPVARTPPPEADVAPRELSEKEKLAASLFGGLSGGGRSVARPSSTSAAAKSSFNVPPPVTTTTTTTSSPMDLLMDLSSPPAPSPAAAVDPFAALEGLSLGEPSQPSAPPAAAAIDLTSLYGGPPPAAMMGMGVGMGAPGMMQQMQPGMMMGMQQQQPAPMGAASVLPSGMGSAPMNPAAAPAKAAEKDPFGDLLG
jgi:AP-4 complex subunit epsilon-1